jgi:hypothetical protein
VHNHSCYAVHSCSPHHNHLRVCSACRGVYLNLNFSRKDCGILDWQPESYWRPRISSTRRTIKLPKELSQEAYNLLCELLHAKFSMRAGDGVGSIA